MNSDKIIVIGAGIVGLATAYQLKKSKPDLDITILEKESDIGLHQTGNNSGVIHSGIYYTPGSAKAINCRKGYKLLLNYCDENDVKYDLCGKVIVATSKDQLPILDNIYKRGLTNGLVNIKYLTPNKIADYEPNVKGLKAILVPETGIIDFREVLKSLRTNLENLGCEFYFNSKVIDIKEKTDSVEIVTTKDSHKSSFVIACAGLQSDRLARFTKPDLDIKIIPFRGEYYKLKSERNSLVKTLVYPVPDPSFPFLGVHFTKKINGEVEAGPNAVLSFKREGYKKLSFNLKDTIDIITWPGFRKLAVKYWKTGVGEFYRSFSKSAFTKALQNLVADIDKDDLIPGNSGIRAQACDIKGNLLDDFHFVKTKRILHVCNAPSPAATASLAIGETIGANFLS